MDTALYTKIRVTESKLDHKIEELFESNRKILESVKKVDKFSVLLEEIKEESEKTRRQLMKNFDESDQTQKNRLEQEVLTINKSFLEY